ncbi:STAS domain-containing protein [Mycobacterium sp. pW049]|uniref:STAS domain-containing protein n=1 Tax=[Mycobacterium] bulgaricum TaxID=3238985 RepID=UPI00351BB02C
MLVQPVDLPRRCGISASSRLSEGVLIVKVGGVIDLATAPTLTDHLRAALASAPPALIIDVTGVEFLAAAGLEVLVSTHDAAAGATSVVVVANGHVTCRPITVTGVDREVPVHPTVHQALAALGCPAVKGSANDPARTSAVLT